MKITGARTAGVEAKYEPGLGKSFLAPGLSQGDIYHGR